MLNQMNSNPRQQPSWLSNALTIAVFLALIAAYIAVILPMKIGAL